MSNKLTFLMRGKCRNGRTDALSDIGSMRLRVRRMEPVPTPRPSQPILEDRLARASKKVGLCADAVSRSSGRLWPGAVVAAEAASGPLPTFRMLQKRKCRPPRRNCESVQRPR